jgi:hypothetical protein
MKPMTRFVLRAGSALALCSVSLSTAFAAPDSSPQPASNRANDTADTAPATSGMFVHKTRPYVLFMGADVTVESDKVFRPIDEVTGSVIVIKSEGKPVNLPFQQSHSFHVRDDLKISAPGVGISNLTSVRVYTKEADSFEKMRSMNIVAAGAADAEDLARGTLLKAQTNYGASPPTGADQAKEQVELAADQAAVDTASLETQRIGEMLGRTDAKLMAHDSLGEYDALRVTFTVTTDKSLAKPYCAIIAQIRKPDSKPGDDQTWIRLQPLGAMAAGASNTVSAYQEGMPPGYIIDKCEVHIYDGREELATNISSKRVLLTRNEMLDFRVIEYISDNNGRTLPATPATFVNDLRPKLSPAELNQDCYVRVAKDGRVAAAFGDKEGTLPLDDLELDAALKGLRFKPAIESGKPVETIVPIRLGMIVAP